MKRSLALLATAATLSAPAEGAAAPQLSYATAGHAIASQLLMKGLPIVKRPPNVKCTAWMLTRQSSTQLSGRFYADDCHGKGFVILVAAKQEGSVVTGWAGSPCRTTGPSKAAKGKIDPGCSLGSFPW